MYHRSLIARVAYEAVRAHRASLGDMSLLAWDDAPVWQRTGALNEVEDRLKAPAEDGLFGCVVEAFKADWKKSLPVDMSQRYDSGESVLGGSMAQGS